MDKNVTVEDLILLIQVIGITFTTVVLLGCTLFLLVYLTIKDN